MCLVKREYLDIETCTEKEDDMNTGRRQLTLSQGEKPGTHSLTALTATNHTDTFNVDF